MERRPGTRRRPDMVVAAAAAVLAAAGLWALVFGRTSSVSWAVDRSQHLAELDSAVADALILQERVERSLILDAAVLGGTADPSAAGALRDDIGRRLADLGGSPSAEASDEAQAYRAAAEAVMERLEAGDLDAARRVSLGELSSRHRLLVDELNLARGETWSQIVDARRAAGTLGTVAGFLLVLFIPAGVILGHRRLLGRRLLRAKAEAEQRAGRAFVQSRDDFIAGVSHELRTPLTGIYGLARVLADRYRLDPVVEDELVGMLASQAGELTRMVDDIITSARHDSGTLTFALGPVSVPAEVREALESLDPAAAPVRVVLDDPDAKILADPIRFRHVVGNLLSNAARHGGPGIRVVGRIEGDRYRVAVVDDGPGVPDDRLSRLFNRFVHEGGSPLTTGSIGLGLSVARILVWGMGGEIWYERSAGSTRFVFDLPLATGRPDSSRMPGVSRPDRSLELAGA